jgi:hypothetical protein
MSGVVSNDTVHGIAVEDTKTAGSGDRAALCVWLDGEGVFKALHALFQVFDLSLLLGQGQVFDSVQSPINAVQPCSHRFEVLLGGCRLEALIDHAGQVFNGDW